MLKKIILPTSIFVTITTTLLSGCGDNKHQRSADVASASETSQIATATDESATTNDANSLENSPIDQVFKKVKDLNDFRILDIRQEFDTPESGKTEATVILTKEGLTDDSVTAERVKYYFKFDHGQWNEVRKEDSWKCGRGPDTTNFSNKICP